MKKVMGWLFVVAAAGLLLKACGSESDPNDRESASQGSEGEAVPTVEEAAGGEVSRGFDTVEELADSLGMWWREERNALLATSRDDGAPGANLESVDLSLLSGLPLKERERVKSLGIGGTELVNQKDFDFGLLPRLSRLGISYNNLNTLKGLDETEVVHVSLSDVPLSDITPISGLEQVEYLWIESTEAIERLPDLSGLAKVTRLGIEANPLKSLDGIETLSHTVGLVLGLVEDVSALERVRPGEVFIVMFPEHQKHQPEIVAEIESYGFDVADTDF